MGSDRAAHLRRLDRSYEPEHDLHFIVDDYGTHSHPVVRAWQEKHPRFALHFTPTSSTWLNLVERWFREFTRKRLPRGTFRSVPELVAAIHESTDPHNEDPKPFVWTVSVHANAAKVSRCRASLETAEHVRPRPPHPEGAISASNAPVCWDISRLPSGSNAQFSRCE